MGCSDDGDMSNDEGSLGKCGGVWPICGISREGFGIEKGSGGIWFDPFKKKCP